MTSVPHQASALDGLTPLRVGVVAPRQRLARVRVLHEALAQHHPAATLTALVLDGVFDQEPFAQVAPADVVGDGSAWHDLAMVLRSHELARALAPFLALHLLSEGDPVLLLGDDVVVQGPLDDLAHLAEEGGAALILRRSAPLPDDDRRPDAVDMAKLGAFDDAIVAVSGAGAPLLASWKRALSESLLADHEERPLLDVAAAGFPHVAVEDPAHGCARWNLDEPGRIATRARTLRLAEFDPAQPHLLAARPSEAPRVLLSDHPELAAICRAYADALFRHGEAVTGQMPYGLDRLACGLPRDDVMRETYRDAIALGGVRGDPPPPDPYDPAEADAFRAWLAEPVARSADGFEVSRYLYEVYRVRGDLQRLFPDLRAAAGPLVEWAYRHGRAELRIPGEVLPPQAPVVPAPRTEPLLEGVNVAGYFRSEFGIGEAARLLVEGLSAAGIPHVTATNTRAPTRHGHEFEDRGGGQPYATNIVCVNVDRIEQFACNAGPGFFEGRRTIGYWWWEAGLLPVGLRPALDVVDEVWVGSHYVRSLIAPVTEKPVHVMPVPIRVTPAPALSREQLGLPGGFVFFFMFDFFSSIERKNPLGLIEAYRRAFGPSDGASLVLKSVNGEERLEELELLRAATADRPDIVLIDRYVTADERNAMMAACDCYASLHRSEGLGLTMAEAMALGKPVVATGWSGNLEFMSEETAYLVRHEMTTLERAHGPYPAGAEWAEPDLGHAAELMRQVFDDRSASAAVGERARASIEQDHGTAPTAAFLRERLSAEAAGAPVSDATGAAASSPRSAAERARQWLDKGLTASWGEGSGRGAVGTRARRAMLRAIRPYTARQAVLDQMLVEAALDARAGVETLHERVSSLEDQLQRLHEFTAELDQRARSIALVRDDLTRLTQQLHAPPSLGDPALLRTRDDQGREVIGFEGGAGGDERDAYLGFENIFRSDEARVAELQRLYVGVLAGHGPILDVGSGRGELLDLLAAAGEVARGVDSDEGMVALSRAKGHDVTLADAVSHLRGLETASLGAIFCAQLVQHLGYADLQAFLAEATRVLRAGGLLVAETVNPEPVQAFKAFWIDPTHKTLLYPDVLLTLCRLAGFQRGHVLFPGGSGVADRDRRTQPAYAVVATMAGSGPRDD